MLRSKLFWGIALTVVLFGILSGGVGVRLISQRVREEAQTRVQFDLSSAWEVLNGQMREKETVLRLAASKQIVAEACQASAWGDPDVKERLERIRVNFGLDFLDLLDTAGRVRIRTAPPYETGDYRTTDAAVSAALKGEVRTCMTLLTGSELDREGEGLAERAFLQLEETPRARKTTREVESRGMVMATAVPVYAGAQLAGVIYGGTLVNRNFDLIDRIHDVVYRHEEYKGRQLGTATIFLDDSRIATTVRRENGNRALGTRVSKAVADRVLDNGQPWIGDAFVVNDWYLTAYDPIRDGTGRIIGMLYVGILKQPFVDDVREFTLRYALLTCFVLAVGLMIAFYQADRLSRPIHRLVGAANRMTHGDDPGQVSLDSVCHETSLLVKAFNTMTRELREREERLKALNRSYMETVGFVSHELKSPVATIMNYVYLMRGEKLGPLTEKQHKAMKVIDDGSQRLVEMVRHYLNLSRIENGELSPVRTRVNVAADVLEPLVDSLGGQLSERNVSIRVMVPAELDLLADLNMVREVFENLATNAIKYGAADSEIRISGERVDGMAHFSVWNAGEGIPPDRIGDMFQKFSRLEGSKAVHRQKGTGLGLFITRHIVTAHGGTIQVKSEAGAWAEFIFTLPLFNPTHEEKA